MITKIRKWGNSQGIRLTHQILAEANLQVRDEVEVTAENGRLIVTASQSIRGRYKLKDLVAKIPKDFKTP